jgi:hypothetical protein
MLRSQRPMHGYKRLLSGLERPAATPDAKDTFELATQFDRRGDLPAAENAYRRADGLGHAKAAVKLGTLLEERDDLTGAERAYRRADDRGDADGSFGGG